MHVYVCMLACVLLPVCVYVVLNIDPPSIYLENERVNWSKDKNGIEKYVTQSYHTWAES